MKIGDKVILRKTNKNGQWWQNKETYRKGTIINIYPTYYLVRCEEGYNECFRESELMLEGEL